MSDLHQALQEDIQAFTPPAAPPFEAIIARRRARGRRRLAAAGAALGIAAVAAAAALPSAVDGGLDRLPSYAAPAPTDDPTTGLSPAPAVSLPPGTRVTNCAGLRAGDPLGDVRDGLYCGSDDFEVSTMDCSNGTYYIVLKRPELDDLEAIVGQSTQWLKAGPVSADHGRTEFAFQNCLETG